MKKYRSLEICKKCGALVEDCKSRYDAYKYSCRLEMEHTEYRDDYITEPLPIDCPYKLESATMIGEQI